MGKVKPNEEPPPNQPVTIGPAAAAAGLSAKAVRLYETRGLLAPPQRTASGYRLYTDTDIARLRFIAAARSLGLHIEQIAEILDTAHDGQQPCTTTQAILGQRVDEITNLITRLTEMRESLAAARDATPDPAAAAICSVIENAPPRHGPSARSRQPTRHRTGSRANRRSGATSG